ncbi:MAG: hypothetical protein JXA46_13000 [Dehalococcoidales bacterium]|nr:hypothetical protein [Dehalococcoidales bacterium]
MSYRISEKCISCHACIWNKVCPAEAITETNEVFSIDPDKCTECGTCFENQQYFCPVRAIVKSKSDSLSRKRDCQQKGGPSTRTSLSSAIKEITEVDPLIGAVSLF